MDYILTFALGVLLSSIFIVEIGFDNGLKAAHVGTHTCQTMPDNTIYCWKTKK